MESRTDIFYSIFYLNGIIGMCARLSICLSSPSVK
uniref:Uncharacterized protein n=1 Tax=Arundo donax TaxID=35708 RepID=A0A0A9CAT2_ARUDO